MLAVPAAIPTMIPVVEVTVAFVGALLLQVPPETAFVKEMVCPTQTLSGPVLEGSAAFTVTVADLWQPVVSAYVIFAVPAAMPVRSPVELPTVAVANAELLQDPPVGNELRIDVFPSQVVRLPAIGVGVGVTSTDIPLRHPSGDVFIRVVPPLANAEKTPEVTPTVPTVVLLLVHVPPDGVAVTVCVVRLQTGVVTDNVGVALTVTTVET